MCGETRSRMLPPDLKQDVLDLAAIAQQCPESLQRRCFELLLSRYLDGLSAPASTSNANLDANAPPIPKNPEAADAADSGEEAAKPQLPNSDLTMMDLHTKAKKFLEKTGTTLEELNQVLYKEGNALLPLYEDLKTTKLAESQIRVGLLLALANGIKTGEFEFDGEAVRKECQTRKCYDGGNFAVNFKNSAGLFDGLEKYDKQSPAIKLSEEGRKELAKAIKELQ